MLDLRSLFDDPHPVALVTGSGAPRVGRTIAEAFHQRGYRVVLHGFHAASEANAVARQWSERGAECLAVSGDLSREEVVAAAFESIDVRFGRIDVLVNSAAIWSRKPLEDVTADDVRRHFETNTLATFLCAQAAGLRMSAQSSGGAIVNVADWAIARPYLDYAAYFPSKGAIPALTRDLAVELAARNLRVRVNAVLPGPVMLPDDLSAAERAASIAGTLLKREGTPRHVADAAIFLAEHDYITGVCLAVDGGRTLG